MPKQSEEWDIEMLTEYGWEVVDCQPSKAEARASKTIYEWEQPGYRYRVRKCNADATKD